MQRVDKTQRRAGHDSMREDVAVERHPSQQQKNAEGPIRQRQRQAGDQGDAHESEILERADQQGVERQGHAADSAFARFSSVSTVLVSPHATGLRASSSVDGKYART